MCFSWHDLVFIHNNLLDLGERGGGGGGGVVYHTMHRSEQRGEGQVCSRKKGFVLLGSSTV